MNLQFEIISPELAGDMQSFMLPYILEGDYKEYNYFAAVDDGKFVGLVVADPTILGPRILSIGISAKYRNQGIGTELLAFAVTNIVMNYDEEELSLPNSISAWVAGKGDDHEALKRVFEKNTFTPHDAGKAYLTTVSELMATNLLISEEMPSKVKHLKEKGELVSLKNVNHQMLNTFSNYLVQNGLYDTIHQEELDEHLTCFGVKDGNIYSCILFAKKEDNRLRNTFLYQNDKIASPNMLRYLLSSSAYEALLNYSVDTELVFWIDNDVTKKLLTRLLPGALVIYTAARYTLTFEDIINARSERFESDYMKPVENKDLACADCTHCTEDITKCKVYLQKPSKVLDGEACPDHMS